MIGNLTGMFTRWTLFDKERQYGTVQNLPYWQACEFIMAVRFNGQTGKGQQREIVERHVRRLKAEMEKGTYTPVNVSAACSKNHREALVLNEDGTFVLPVNSDDPLLHTDGGHRFDALRQIVKGLGEKANKAEGKDKEEQLRWLEQARNVPVTVTVYFDGEPAQDFVRLQHGRPVDRAHIFSMEARQNLLDARGQLSHEIARQLNKQAGSPVLNAVRFDSRGTLSLPVSTICSTGKSNLGTSLVGLAGVGLAFGKDAEWLASAVTSAFVSLHARAPSLLEYGKVLTPPSNSGTKGASTMLIGLGTMLAYRACALGHETPTEDDLGRLAKSAELCLDESVAGSFSDPTKRKLMGEFAKDYLADLAGDKHCELPVGLLRVLSPSALSVAPLPREKKPKKERPPKAAKKTKAKKAIPDVDAPVAAAIAPPAAAVA
jgi:hypothetical protein